MDWLELGLVIWKAWNDPAYLPALGGVVLNYLAVPEARELIIDLGMLWPIALFLYRYLSLNKQYLNPLFAWILLAKMRFLIFGYPVLLTLYCVAMIQHRNAKVMELLQHIK